MSSSSSEEVFELNYVKIDSKNDIRLLDEQDLEIETYGFMTSVTGFEQEKIGKNISSYLRKVIPESHDILKTNIDYSKQFVKLINSDKKKNLYSAINHILSIDFNENFIFNKANIFDTTIILTYCFNELKKYKISSPKDLKIAINKIKYDKYDFFQIFANYDYLKNKDKEKIDLTLSRVSSQCKSTTFSSYGTPLKDLYNEVPEIDENDLNEINKNQREARGYYYIDNNEKNIISSSTLIKDYNNNEEEGKKVLSKECFYYPKYNKNSLSEPTELPIELILLLSKFRNIKTLIFQIHNVDDQFLKMSIFILMNIKLLFINGIEEFKFDLGNEEIQQGLNTMFNERTKELYSHFHKIQNLVYFTGSYQARTSNCWEPEGDIFFFENTTENDGKGDYIYITQPNDNLNTFDNQICNIYNEFGNLTNLKYIRPISYTFRNKNNEFQYDSKIEEIDDNNFNINSELLNISAGEIQRLERESISLTNTMSFTSKNSIQNIPQININQINNDSTSKSTPQMLSNFVNKYKTYFHMIIIYAYFFSKNIKKLKKLSTYFHTPYSYEISLLFNLKLNIDIPHFLIFANQIETLTEVNFSFNSLDDKSFEYILGIINKNSNLSSLKISFFTPDVNYYDNSLFNLCSSKKISLTKLFQEQKEYEIKFGPEKMNSFILNEKLLESFSSNLINFFNMLKIKLSNKLEEIILRFDIPLPLLHNQKYNSLIIKFIINLLIMFTFQENKVHTLKFLAPNLELDCSKKPYIRQFFKEISLKDEIEEKLNNENEIKERKKIKQKELKEQREKENELKEKKKELKQKNERKGLLEKIISKEHVYEIPQDNKDNLNDEDEEENNDEIDIDKNLENYSHKRFNSMVQKKQLEQAARRKESISIEDNLSKKRSELNKNISLKNLVLQFKFYDLPEIFNICLMNNMNGLQMINLGILDEITFIGFMNAYKSHYHKLHNLTSLKLTLATSLTSYISLEKYILEYININSPKIEEKFLFTDLQIISESKMKDLIELVYNKALVKKLVIQISNDNEHMLAKVFSKYYNEKKNQSQLEMYSLVYLMTMPKFNKIYNKTILECLGSFYGNNKKRAVICKENPNRTSF